MGKKSGGRSSVGTGRLGTTETSVVKRYCEGEVQRRDESAVEVVLRVIGRYHGRDEGCWGTSSSSFDVESRQTGDCIGGSRVRGGG